MATKNSNGTNRRSSSGNRSKSKSTGSSQSQANRSKQNESGGIGGFLDAVKQRPLASAAIAAGAAGASAFLWARRSQIGEQITELTGGDEQVESSATDTTGDLGSTVGTTTTGTRRRGRPSKASLDVISDDQTEVGAIAYGA